MVVMPLGADFLFVGEGGVRGFVGSWVRGFAGSWVRGFVGSWARISRHTSLITASAWLVGSPQICRSVVLENGRSCRELSPGTVAQGSILAKSVHSRRCLVVTNRHGARSSHSLNAMSVVAVIAGAGSGTRLGSQGPKALVLLGGEPLLVHAVRSMAQSGVIDACVVTAPVDDVVTFREVLKRAGLDAHVVAGGVSRQASVAAGLDAAGDAEFVLIHDAARALTPVEQIRGVVAALRAGHPAVVPALPVVDTIKRVGPVVADGTEPVLETLDRGVLRGMQTPQGFPMAVIREAHRRFAASAANEANSAPDDAFLVEAAGLPVVLVPGSELAMKVTRPLDLRIAELLLEEGLGAEDCAD